MPEEESRKTWIKEQQYGNHIPLAAQRSDKYQHLTTTEQKTQHPQTEPNYKENDTRKPQKQQHCTFPLCDWTEPEVDVEN